MAGSVNKVILIGRLGKDPDVRTMQSGDKVVSFGLATSETWRDKASGERKEKTEWHNVVIFNENLARVAEQYLKKGSSCYIEGQLQTRKYTDKDGNERQTTEVVLQRFRGELTLLDSRGGRDSMGDEGGGGSYGGRVSSGGSSSGGGSFGRTSPMEKRPASGGGRMAEQIDDDIPF